MIERRCACGKPLRDQATFCGDCLHRTRNHLANQAAWLTDIETELARLARKTAANDGGRASATTGWAQAGDVYLDDVTQELLREWDRRKRAAANVMHEQRALLVSWTRLITDEGLARNTDWLINSVPVMAAYIEATLPKLRLHEAGPELVYEFRTLAAHVLRVIDSPQDRARIPAGPCCEEYADDYGRKEPCPGLVTAYVPADESIPPVMRCGTCKIEYRSERWLRAGIRIQERAEQIKAQRAMAEAIGRKT
jgi:hypothetical protein